jgi:hypothetical protein
MLNFNLNPRHSQAYHSSMLVKPMISHEISSRKESQLNHDKVKISDMIRIKQADASQ